MGCVGCAAPHRPHPGIQRHVRRLPSLEPRLHPQLPRPRLEHAQRRRRPAHQPVRLDSRVFQAPRRSRHRIERRQGHNRPPRRFNLIRQIRRRRQGQQSRDSSDHERPPRPLLVRRVLLAVAVLPVRHRPEGIELLRFLLARRPDVVAGSPRQRPGPHALERRHPLAPAEHRQASPSR